MGRRLERWRRRQLELLTPPSGRLRKPAKKAGYAFDVTGFLGWYPFRPLGNLQTTCFIISEPSKTFKQPVLSFPTPRKASNNLFHHFRALENLQTTCFIKSEPSKTFKQPVSSNPSPRKPSNNLFHHFRALGASADAGEESRVHDARNEHAHQTGSRPEWTDAGYDHSPHTGACEEGVCDTPLPYRPAASAGIKKAGYMQRMSPHVPGFLGWRP